MAFLFFFYHRARAHYIPMCSNIVCRLHTSRTSPPIIPGRENVFGAVAVDVVVASASIGSIDATRNVAPVRERAALLGLPLSARARVAWKLPPRFRLYETILPHTRALHVYARVHVLLLLLLLRRMAKGVKQNLSSARPCAALRRAALRRGAGREREGGSLVAGFPSVHAQSLYTLSSSFSSEYEF